MLHLHLYLALACASLLAVVGVQDYLVPVLRQKSISAGLTGPYHWYLDAAMFLLAAALIVAFRHSHWYQSLLAEAAGVSLIFTALSGTYTTNLGVNGEKIHSALTAVTFVLAIVLQLVFNHTPAMWTITGFGIVGAILTHFLVPVASTTEKMGVLGLCAWLIAWSL
jgi:hypothetical protein